MVAGLVEYLIGTNEYCLNDITILTPYNRQLACLTEGLRARCSLWLSDSDREGLIADGLLDPEEPKTGRPTNLETGDMLKLATIDNFQGEESKIVILSLVRSNSEGRVGFMKTPNRINVACSRARDGFYIVGNASLMRQVPVWNTIIDSMISKKSLGPDLRTCCSRHRDNIHLISSPDHWISRPPCNERCTFQYAGCSHLCDLTCHAGALHSLQGCTKPCERQHKGCGHKCTNLCGSPCDDCTRTVSTVVLDCGHEVQLTCLEVSEGVDHSSYECRQIIGDVLLDCGHQQDVICSKTGRIPACTGTCGQVLPCGHACPEICSICSVLGSHPPCKARCGRSRPQCNHTCEALCHPGAHCPPCERPCERTCLHKSCKQLCSKVCDPCVRGCTWACEHQGSCDSICCLPCTRLPCDERCPIKLQCGHLCSGLCGEMCPSKCFECKTGHRPDQPQIFLPCGHQFDVPTLDTSFVIDRIYQIDDTGVITGLQKSRITMCPDKQLSCPRCGCHIAAKVRRYALFQQLQLITDNVDRLHAKFSRKTNSFMDMAYRSRMDMENSFPDFQNSIRPGPLFGGSNELRIRERSNTLSALEDTIGKFRGEKPPLT